MIQHGTSKYK